MDFFKTIEQLDSLPEEEQDDARDALASRFVRALVRESEGVPSAPDGWYVHESFPLLSDFGEVVSWLEEACGHQGWLDRLFRAAGRDSGSGLTGTILEWTAELGLGRQELEPYISLTLRHPDCLLATRLRRAWTERCEEEDGPEPGDDNRGRERPTSEGKRATKPTKPNTRHEGGTKSVPPTTATPPKAAKPVKEKPVRTTDAEPAAAPPSRPGKRNRD